MLKKLFSDSGDISMTRLCLFICVLTSCFISIYAIITDRNLSDLAILVGALLSFTSLAKAGQSFSPKENKKQ